MGIKIGNSETLYIENETLPLGRCNYSYCTQRLSYIIFEITELLSEKRELAIFLRLESFFEGGERSVGILRKSAPLKRTEYVVESNFRHKSGKAFPVA